MLNGERRSWRVALLFALAAGIIYIIATLLGASTSIAMLVAIMTPLIVGNLLCRPGRLR